MFLKYRPEIDGLRAIAITAVVLFHAEFLFYGTNPFKGGYIGVDVFFVISGYLITLIILREISNGKFRFRNFYERRARRILPPLFTVIFISIPFAWMYMLPKAVMEYAGSILSTLGFVSNIWFWKEDSYWAEPSALKPFLHTWSLSVEEQFYVIFPILLLILSWRFKKYMGSIFVLSFLFLLQFSDFASVYFPEANFFLLPSRGWELLAGAILAKMELENGRVNPSFLTSIMPSVGLFLICYGIVFFKDEIQHPSFMTLLPVLGTMLLIWFCKKGELVSDILGSKLFVAIGLISYSLYLWHQPIFAFSKILNINQSFYLKLGCIFLSIIFAIFTYFIIEKPFRNREKVSFKTLIFSLTIGAIMIIIPVGYAFNNNGLWGKFAGWQLKYIGVNQTDPTLLSQYVITGFNSLINKEFAENKTQKRLLIIGDSFAQDFYNVLKENGLLKGIDVSTHYIPAICKNVPYQTDVSQYIQPQYITACTNLTRIGDPRLDKRLGEADFVVVTSCWDFFTSSQLANLHAEIKKRSNAKIYVVSSKNFYKLNIEDIMSSKSINDLFKLTLNAPNSHYEFIKAQRKGMSNNSDDYLDLYTLICGDCDRLPFSTPEGDLISYDGSHLTKQGATYIGHMLLKDKKFMEKWYSVFAR